MKQFDGYVASADVTDLSDTIDALNLPAEAADTLRKALCRAVGHILTPDHCCIPTHDLCMVCGEYANELGFERIPEKMPHFEWRLRAEHSQV